MEFLNCLLLPLYGRLEYDSAQMKFVIDARTTRTWTPTKSSALSPAECDLSRFHVIEHILKISKNMIIIIRHVQWENDKPEEYIYYWSTRNHFFVFLLGVLGLKLFQSLWSGRNKTQRVLPTIRLIHLLFPIRIILINIVKTNWYKQQSEAYDYFTLMTPPSVERIDEAHTRARRIPVELARKTWWGNKDRLIYFPASPSLQLQVRYKQGYKLDF
jgi:hypothetical protein